MGNSRDRSKSGGGNRSRRRREARRTGNRRPSTDAGGTAPKEVPSGRPVAALPGASGPSGAAPADGGVAPPPTGGPDLGRYWQVIWNRRALVAGVFATVVVGVMLGTLLRAPVYRATGTIEIRQAAADVMPMEALFELARIPDQYMETQYGLLRSPALARRVARDLRLAAVEEFNPEAEPDGEAGGDPGGRASAEAMERVVREFRDRLSVQPVEGSRLVQISFESRDPELAAQVVNSIFANYVEARAEAAHTAVDRLSAQVDSVRLKLAESEARLQEFVSANELLFLEGEDGNMENVIGQRLRQLEEQLTEAEADLYAKQSRYGLVRQGNYEALDSEALQSLSVPLAELESEYARLRTIFTDKYPRTRQAKRQLEALRSQVEKEKARIAAEIRSEYRAAARRHALLREAIEEQKTLLDRFAAEASQYRILKRDVDAHQLLYAQLQQKEKEAGVVAAMATAEVAVVDPAVAPQEPFRPAPGRNLVLASIAGLLLGIGLAFVREYTDPRVNGVDEVDSMADVPVLALIPSARSLAARHGRRLAALPLPRRGLPPPAGGEAPTVPATGWVRIDQQHWDDSVLADAFGSLRTSVLFESEGPPPRSLLVTSVQAAEGKTTVSINLAISLARLGRRVLLIDADVRRPAVHRAFGFETYPGLAEYLAGTADWRGFLRPNRVPGLDILPSGRPPDRPSELLSSDRMRGLVERARDSYDFVVLDSPALLVNVADARILAPLSDGIVVVARSGITPRDVLQRVLRQLPNVIGVVVNDLAASHFSNYYRAHRDEESGAEAGSGRPKSIPGPGGSHEESEEDADEHIQVGG